MTDELKLEPCPFCNDPMQVTNAGCIQHLDRPEWCIIRDLGWDITKAPLWNTRKDNTNG